MLKGPFRVESRPDAVEGRQKLSQVHFSLQLGAESSLLVQLHMVSPCQPNRSHHWNSLACILHNYKWRLAVGWQGAAIYGSAAANEPPSLCLLPRSAAGLNLRGPIDCKRGLVNFTYFGVCLYACPHFCLIHFKVKLQKWLTDGLWSCSLFPCALRGLYSCQHVFCSSLSLLSNTSSLNAA